MKQRFKLPLDLQLFAEEGGEGGQEGAEQKPAKIEFTPEQQAAVDALIKDRLTRQQKKFEDEKEAARAEAERKEREKNEEYKALYESAQAELDRLRGEAKTAELNATKTRLLVEAGYNAEQIARVSKYVLGDDEEAIKASIVEVVADIPPRIIVDPNLNNNPRMKPLPSDPTAIAKERIERLRKEGKLR